MLNDDALRTTVVDSAVDKVKKEFSLLENTKKIKDLFVSHSAA